MSPRIALVLHILSLTILAAGGIGGLLVHRPLSAAAKDNLPQLPGLAAAALRLAMAARIGAVLMLVSGINLLWTLDWIDASGRWFHFKMTLYVLIWIASLGVAAPAAAKLWPAIAQRVQGQDTGAVIDKSLSRLAVFHLFTAAAFVAIITLSVMRP